jgi:hypothetical protein
LKLELHHLTNYHHAQMENWLVEFYRKNNGLPVDIVNRLRAWCSACLIKASILPATYAQALPRNPGQFRPPRPGNRRRRDGP